MAEPSTSNKAVSVLFVCLGNICRSPMAEAVFAHTLSSRPSTSSPAFAKIDSAGTAGFHVGSSPDPRTMETLKSNGIASYRHAARKVSAQDFDDFDYIFGMDTDNVEDLESLRKRVASQRKKQTGDSGEQELAKVMMFGAFGGKSRPEEVGDPYYAAGDDGFKVAFEQLTRFSKGFLSSLEKSSK